MLFNINVWHMKELIIFFFLSGFFFSGRCEIMICIALKHSFSSPEKGWVCNAEDKESCYFEERCIPFGIPLAWLVGILSWPVSLPVCLTQHWQSCMVSAIQKWNLWTLSEHRKEKLTALDLTTWKADVWKDTPCRHEEPQSFLRMCVRKDVWADTSKTENILSCWLQDA